MDDLFSVIFLFICRDFQGMWTSQILFLLWIRTQKHHTDQQTTFMQWQPRDLTILTLPFSILDSLCCNVDSTEAQPCPKDRSFQLSTNVCSIFFVCSEWESCFFSLTLLRTVRQMTQCQRGRFGGQQGLPGWPELLQLHSSISRRGRIKHLLPESDDLWSRVDYWIAFDGGPQSPWSSHCNTLCSTLTQSISILHLGIYCFLWHISAEDIDPWQYLQRKSS